MKKDCENHAASGILRGRAAFVFPAVTGFLLFVFSTACLNSEIAMGILGIAGILMLLIAARHATGKKRLIMFSLLLWCAVSTRYSLLFGENLFFILVVALCLIPYTLLFAAAALADNLLRKKGRGFLGTLIFPTVFTLAIVLMVLMDLGNIPNQMTYLMCLPVVSANLSVLNEYVMTFILCLVLSLLADVVSEEKNVKPVISLVLSLILCAGLTVSGFALSKEEEEPDFILNVAVATHGEMDFLGNSETETTHADRISLFENTVKQAVAGGADFLVLAEEFVSVEKSEEAEVLNKLCEILRENSMPAIICTDCMSDSELSRNNAYFVSEDGEILLSYRKRNLVPFIEGGSYEAGEDDPESIDYTFRGKTVTLSVILCFDINDDFLIHTIPEETELLIVPSWDWDYCNIEQKRTRIRSIEIGATLLKHSYEGFSFVSEPNGHTGDYLDNRGQYEKVSMMQVPIWEK